ncbi:MAG TPA: shikimate kinase [Spirochaetia bacterium]|nr:shikimate kinase [Spirochaetia bacterium]
METKGIYLVGFSGTGKSTIARPLGLGLGWPVFDLDACIVERCGMAIPEIFAQEGEAGFRAREAAALREIPESGPFVMATGGGAFVAAENRALMASRGWAFALEARPETIYARIERQRRLAEPGAARPLLEAGDPIERIRSLKALRQGAYALADWTVHTDRLCVEQVVGEILRGRELLEAAKEVV